MPQMFPSFFVSMYFCFFIFFLLLMLSTYWNQQHLYKVNLPEKVDKNKNLIIKW